MRQARRARADGLRPARAPPPPPPRPPLFFGHPPYPPPFSQSPPRPTPAALPAQRSPLPLHAWSRISSGPAPKTAHSPDEARGSQPRPPFTENHPAPDHEPAPRKHPPPHYLSPPACGQAH